MIFRDFLDWITGQYSISGRISDEYGELRTVNYSFVDASASGDTEAIPAQGAGLRIRVVALEVIAADIVSVRFRSATNNISSAKALAKNGGFVRNLNPVGWFQTNLNEPLNINLSTAVPVGCDIVWIVTK